MKTRGLFSRGVGLGAAGLALVLAAAAVAQEPVVGEALRPADLRFDFARGEPEAPRAAAMEGADYAVSAEARYDPGTQNLTVTGTYRLAEPLADGAALSYQVYDDAGELLAWDGVRFGWDAAGREASFDLVLPILDAQPSRQMLRVQFNAVVEGAYWYGERFPEQRFAAIDLVNLPRRDHYRPGWTWIPAVLPAQTRCLIPVSFAVGYRDEAHRGYVASMDVVDPAHTARLESRRREFVAERGEVFTWLPLGALNRGMMEMRPGLVWENVRWYGADDWFAYQEVRLIPPLLYVGMALGGALLLGVGWGWIGRWPGRALRALARVAVLAALAWVVANLVVTGYWLALVLLAGVALVRRVGWRRPGLVTYAVVWMMLAFIEYYWGRMSGVARVRPGATVFALAAWALVLLPLVFMRRKWLRRSIGCGVVVTWLLLSTGAVIYFQFFQDFPSVENLLYAGQVGELGDSIVSLVEQRHLIPVLVMAYALAIWWWPNRRNEAKAQG